jgi:ribonuclease P protein component
VSFRLTRQGKLSKPSEYKTIFNDGAMARGKYWQVMALQTSSNKAKIGLAISKKVHRLAVERNRFKRIARETFRLKQTEFNHWEFVIMAKRAKPANNAVIAQDLAVLLTKIVAQ